MNRHNDCLGGARAPRLCRYHQHIPNGRRFEADTIAFAAAKIPLRREKTNFSRLNLPHCVPWGTIRSGGVGRKRREGYFPERPSGWVVGWRSRGPESGYKAGGREDGRWSGGRTGDGVAVKPGGRAAGRATDRVVPQGWNGGRQDGRQGEDGRRGGRKDRATDGAAWQGRIAWLCYRASRQGRNGRQGAGGRMGK